MADIDGSGRPSYVAEHERSGERPCLRPYIAGRGDRQSCFLGNLTYHSMLCRFAGLDESRQYRPTMRFPGTLAGKRDAVLVVKYCGNDGRVCTREYVVALGTDPGRPTARNAGGLPTPWA